MAGSGQGDSRGRRALAALAVAGLLAACAPGAGPDGPAASTARGAAADVEAPEVFQLTDQALWDGRPSLGGVWVAHADARDPERVIMRNAATGKSVVGALFRRERLNPGPRLQVSADAAAALGMLAGQPAELSVTALRRAESAPEAATEPPGADAADESPAPRRRFLGGLFGSGPAAGDADSAAAGGPSETDAALP